MNKKKSDEGQNSSGAGVSLGKPPKLTLHYIH